MVGWQNGQDRLVFLDSTGMDSFTELKRYMRQIGDDVRIALPDGSSILLDHVQMKLLDSGDFSF